MLESLRHTRWFHGVWNEIFSYSEQLLGFGDTRFCSSDHWVSWFDGSWRCRRSSHCRGLRREDVYTGKGASEGVGCGGVCWSVLVMLGGETGGGDVGVVELGDRRRSGEDWILAWGIILVKGIWGTGGNCSEFEIDEGVGGFLGEDEKGKIASKNWTCWES